MTNSDIIKGSALQVWVNGSTIAFATSHTFQMTVNVNEVATKDHGDYPAQIPTNITWEVSCENLYATDSLDTLLSIAKAKQPVTVKFCEVANYGRTGHQGTQGSQGHPGTGDEMGIVGGTDTWMPGHCIATGQAIITSFSVNAAASDDASISCTFTGNGAFTTDAAAQA